jgi:hypothetical protein
VHECDDYLLYALSACGRMSWQSFKKVVESLYVKYAAAANHPNGSSRQLAWRSLRALECLGHADAAFTANESSVATAPAVLCRLPISGLPQAVICGGRSPATQEALADACRGLPCSLSVEPQSGRASGEFIPARIAVESETEEALAQLASRLRVSLPPVPPAWVLLEYSGTAEEYMSTCPRVVAPELDWPRLDFDTQLLQFRWPGASASALRLSKYQHPARGTAVHRLWRGESFQDVDRDWGRYVALRAAARNVLAYDGRLFLLAVPSGAPLPRLLARACALCSGYAPRPAGQRPGPPALPAACTYDMYRAVPPDIAAAVAAKIGQRLLPADLNCFLED